MVVTHFNPKPGDRLSITGTRRDDGAYRIGAVTTTTTTAHRGYTLSHPFFRRVAKVRHPRVYCGGAYWPAPGVQWIVTGVLRHGKGWRVEFLERWTGGERSRVRSLGYLDFCIQAHVDP